MRQWFASSWFPGSLFHKRRYCFVRCHIAHSKQRPSAQTRLTGLERSIGLNDRLQVNYTFCPLIVAHEVPGIQKRSQDLPSQSLCDRRLLRSRSSIHNRSGSRPFSPPCTSCPTGSCRSLPSAFPLQTIPLATSSLQPLRRSHPALREFDVSFLRLPVVYATLSCPSRGYSRDVH